MLTAFILQYEACRRMRRTWWKLSVVLLLLQLPLQAQEKPPKWGEVPPADLDMKSFPADTNAAAVVLSDIGRAYFNEEFGIEFERHRRVKILSEAGYDWGSFVVTYYAKNRIQRVAEIEGYTFTRGPGGAVRRDKLDKKAIFDEDVDGEYRRVRATLPALAPGCVIEYRYKLKIKEGYYTYLPDWEFQTSEPTRWSEYRAEIPSMLGYAMVWQGMSKLEINEAEMRDWPPLMPYAQTAGIYNLKMSYHRWAMRDMPALRREPYMTPPSDHLAKIDFQLTKIMWPGSVPQDVMNTWEKLAEDLVDSDHFGKQLDRHKVLRQQAETLVAGLTSPEDKLRAIYDYVRTTMTWEEKFGIYVDVDLDKALQARRGGGPEIGLMLTSMLRFAGLEACPVLISTRQHGRVLQIYPLLTQFNHVLTYVKAGAREYLLEATDPLCPLTLVPEHSLNQVGWLVDKKNPRWIGIANPGALSNNTVVVAKLTSEGAITGHFESSDEGYSGLFDRHTLLNKKKKEEDYVRDGWLSDMTGAQLDSFKISNQDSIYVPLLTRAHFSSNDHAQVMGDKIYFNPMLFGRREENPFKSPERFFPVDFAYGHKYIFTLNLTLPEGYDVQEVPKYSAATLPNGGGQFKRQVQVDGNRLQMISQMIISKPRFEPAEYRSLRDFYDRIVTAHADQVVLTRSKNVVTQ